MTLFAYIGRLQHCIDREGDSYQYIGRKEASERRERQKVLYIRRFGYTGSSMIDERGSGTLYVGLVKVRESNSSSRWAYIRMLTRY